MNERALLNILLVSIADHSCLYRTGDFARLVKGTIIYEGRTDSQVKVRGHRVDLSEVENAVAAVPGIDKSVVLCYRPGQIEQVTNIKCSTDRAVGHTDT
jgi:acyl-coenzyme A synthetase/AMP-(fatty) acid ligase